MYICPPGRAGRMQKMSVSHEEARQSARVQLQALQQQLAQQQEQQAEGQTEVHATEALQQQLEHQVRWLWWQVSGGAGCVTHCVVLAVLESAQW